MCSIDLGSMVDADGKTVRRRINVRGKTKKEVLEKSRAVDRTAIAKRPQNAATLSVSAFLDEWLNTVVRPNQRPNTIAQYESTIRNHLKPRVGHIRLSKLSPQNVQALHAETFKDGVGSRTRQLCHVVLRCALQTAISWGYLTLNPCDAVPRPKVARKAMVVWTDEEARRFLDTAASDRLAAFYALALASGARLGELLGIRWEDLDLKKGTIRITQQLVEIGSKRFIAPPKTDAGLRTIRIPNFAVEALRRHRKAMLAEGNHAAPLVFCTKRGTPVSRSNLRKRSFHPLMEAAGVTKISFHQLRHSSATLLLEQGTDPKTLQERLGHASPRTTLEVYAHSTNAAKERAAAALENVLSSVRR